ncbi:MAG: hypothetical protein Q8P29_02265 [Candidatus Levybacteria bacterium]|nr:hypothetical protein [Candidatus Levybacteria bacterium]
MRLFARNLIIFFFLLSSSVFFVQSIFAAEGIGTETGYRFPTTCTTNGSSCENMREQDDKYNSWVNASSKEVVATFEDFGIHDDALFIRNFRVKLRMRSSVNGILWAPLFSIDYGATYFGQAYGCDYCYYATTSFNSIDNYNLRWYADYRLPNFVPAEDLNSGKFRLKIRQKYASVNTTDIDTMLFNIEYAVPITPTPTPIPTKTPLILIPGIGGSELKSDQTFTSTVKDCGILPAFTYSANDIVWVNTIIAGFSLCDDYFDILKLKADGQTPEYPQIVLNGTFFGGAYNGFIKFFTDNGYELNKTLFLFPYDWRKDIGGTKGFLDDEIQKIKTQTGSAKVDIVAHSMGGLVARNYISDSTKAQNVRKLFILGTPHLGSGKFLKALIYGDCLTLDIFQTLPICVGLGNSEIKDILQNMISGYELAPSQTYFNFYSGEDSGHPYPYKTESGALDYAQIKNLLIGLNFNTSLFTPSEAFHTLDNSLSNTNGVDITVIAGSGQPTLGQIVEEKRISLLGLPYVHKDMMNINGDGTVPLFSASLNDSSKNLSLFDSTKVFYTNQDHGSLVSSGPALNLVKNVLDGNSDLPDRVSRNPYHFSGTGVSVHSPVNVHVYDTNHKHTGPTSDGDFEANIPGSSYDALDDAKFIYLPDNGIYTIKFEATDQGSFDFKIRKFENDTNTTAVLYNDISLTAATKAETVLDALSVQPPTLQIDQDGNGTIDKEVNPTFILTGDEVYDDTPPEANIRFDIQAQDIAITGLDNLGETTIIQTPISKNKEQNVITDKSGNTLALVDINRFHGPNAVFSISSLAYNTLPTALDTNKLSISYQTDKNGAIKSFGQKFEIKGIIKIQLSYDPKTDKTLVTLDRQRTTVDGMKILQITTEKGSLKYSY